MLPFYHPPRTSSSSAAAAPTAHNRMVTLWSSWSIPRFYATPLSPPSPQSDTKGHRHDNKLWCWRWWRYRGRRRRPLWTTSNRRLLAMVGWIILGFLSWHTLLWNFRHLQCWSREAGVHWYEAPIHNVYRSCPAVPYPVADMTTTDDKNNKPHICITTLSDKSPQHRESMSWYQRFITSWERCRDFDQVAARTWPNQQQYATKHGYTIFDASALLDSSRPPAWSKIKAVQHMLELKKHDDDDNTKLQCDFVLWLDADIVVMNSNMALEHVLPVDPTIHLLVTHDRRFGANSGAWLMRNTAWSRHFLATWWNMTDWVRPRGLSLSGDNAAFGHLVAQHATLMQQPPSLYRPIVHVPRCQFNSFAVFVTAAALQRQKNDVHNMEYYGSPDFYHAGDLMAHASGIDQKARGVELLLQRAQ